MLYKFHNFLRWHYPDQVQGLQGFCILSRFVAPLFSYLDLNSIVIVMKHYVAELNDSDTLSLDVK